MFWIKSDLQLSEEQTQENIMKESTWTSDSDLQERNSECASRPQNRDWLVLWLVFIDSTECELFVSVKTILTNKKHNALTLRDPTQIRFMSIWGGIGGNLCCGLVSNILTLQQLHFCSGNYSQIILLSIYLYKTFRLRMPSVSSL